MCEWRHCNVVAAAICRRSGWSCFHVCTGVSIFCNASTAFLGPIGARKTGMTGSSYTGAQICVQTKIMHQREHVPTWLMPFAGRMVVGIRWAVMRSARKYVIRMYVCFMYVCMHVYMSGVHICKDTSGLHIQRHTVRINFQPYIAKPQNRKTDEFQTCYMFACTFPRKIWLCLRENILILNLLLSNINKILVLERVEISVWHCWLHMTIQLWIILADMLYYFPWKFNKLLSRSVPRYVQCLQLISQAQGTLFASFKLNAYSMYVHGIHRSIPRAKIWSKKVPRHGIQTSGAGSLFTFSLLSPKPFRPSRSAQQSLFSWRSGAEYWMYKSTSLGRPDWWNSACFFCAFHSHPCCAPAGVQEAYGICESTCLSHLCSLSSADEHCQVSTRYIARPTDVHIPPCE